MTSGAWRGQLTPVLIDLLLPILAFYLLRAVGLGQVPALVIGAAFPLARIAWSFVAERRIDFLALFVLVIMLLGLASTFIGGSPRMMLAKDAWLMGACGIAVLVTLRRTPLMFTVGRTLLRRTGRSAREWDQQWQESAPFRRVWRVLTVLWGAALIAEAGVQVLMAYTLPIDAVPALSTVQWLAALVLLQVITQVYVHLPRVKRLL